MSFIPTVFEFTHDRSRALGVPHASGFGPFVPGTPLQLRYFTDPKVQVVWDFDPTLGFIILDFSARQGGTKLAVDFKDGRVAAETPIVLEIFTGAPSQRWSLSIRPGYITSLANPELVIDDHFGSTQPDNPIWAFPFNGTGAQQWTATQAFQAIAAKSAQKAA
ncbi:hypothetical protein PTKU46_94930 [Paraburkholderia terrae]|uniref:RICIN domain-containing protein n=1 Tax=Paraburkholderia terrae TaxID=311230 RepID=UPI0030E307B9